MSMNASTNVQWTMKLSDAALICDTLRRAADDAQSAADYLRSDRYADAQQKALEGRESAKPVEQRLAKKDRVWVMPQGDIDRIAANEARAQRLYELAAS